MRVSLFFFLIATLFFSSCVSQKKYLEEVGMRNASEAREQRLKEEIEALNNRIESLQNQIAYKDGQLTQLGDQIANLELRNQALQAELNRMQAEFDKFINESISQQERLDLAIKAKADELAQKEQLINQLQEAIAQRDKAMQNILNRIQGALQQYSAEDLSVELRDGKVYVALSDKLLFESGSAKVDKLGKEALGKLAGALSRNPDISVRVEGHTDSIPIRTAVFKDNWDLSVIRATSVVRILTEEYGLSPAQVTASGKSEYVPKAPNASREGRALNRRTEIIIEPKLDVIYNVIQNQTQRE